MSWLGQIERELEKMEPESKDSDFLQDDWEPWQKKAAQEFSKMMFPTANLKKGDSSFTAKQLGSILGHKLAAFKFWGSGFHYANSLPPKTPIEVIELFKGCDQAITEMQSFVLRGVRRCLAIACRQSLYESAELMEGFARALKKGTLNEQGRLQAATSTLIFYGVLIFNGAAIKQHVSSVHQLHQLLCHKFGEQLIGDIKTTEKRCQRIGLTFRKPGRPKKNTDT